MGTKGFILVTKYDQHVFGTLKKTAAHFLNLLPDVRFDINLRKNKIYNS